MLAHDRVLDPRAHLWTDAELRTFARGLGLHADRPGRLLDLGCGWGSLGLALARLHPRLTVIGLDLDEDLVALGREVARFAGLQRRVTLRIDDVQDLDAWLDGHPEVVVCQALLVHTPRVREWLGELADHLTPGTHLGVVEADPVVRALGLRDSVTDADPTYRQRRVAVAEAVTRGARALGVDRRVASHLVPTLAAAGFAEARSREIRQQPVLDVPWLRHRFQRRIAGNGDPVDHHLAEQGGLPGEALDGWVRAQRRADEQRLAALDRGDYFRLEGGTFAACARV